MPVAFKEISGISGKDFITSNFITSQKAKATVYKDTSDNTFRKFCLTIN